MAEGAGGAEEDCGDAGGPEEQAAVASRVVRVSLRIFDSLLFAAPLYPGGIAMEMRKAMMAFRENVGTDHFSGTEDPYLNASPTRV
jgi:hypothetical protein